MSQHSPRLLVVGGNGFIGRHIVSHAVAKGWSVTSLSLSYRHDRQGSYAGVRYVVADISNINFLREALSGNSSFEFVLNCGGYIDHTLFLRGGQKLLDAHFMGVLNIVEVLDRNVLQALVNIGSSDEYGNSPAPQAEVQREAPISPYSLAKVAATHFLQMLYRTEGIPVITLRLFLTYGPGQDNQRFLPQIISGCLKGLTFPTSKGEQLRDFCYVEDMVAAVFSAFSSPIARGEVINVASGQPVSIRQMIETVRRLVGQGEPRYGEIAYRPSENMKLYADISKANALLGWTPKIQLEAGLAKTIQWIKDQN